MKRSHKTSAVVALIASAAIALTGCATDAGTPSTSEPGQPITLKFVQGQPTDFAPVWVAIDQGFFTDAGLDVTAEASSAQTAAEAAALLVSGDFQLAVSALPSIAAAGSQGVNLKIVSGLTTIGGPNDDSIAIIGKRSGPSDLKELATSGTVIGISGGQLGANHVMTMNAIDKAGGDSSAPSYQTVPYAQAAELVLNDSVKAANVIEPFRGNALANPDLTMIGSVSSALEVGTPSLSLVTSADYADGNSEVVAKLQSAIAKSIAWINDPANEDAYLDIVSKNSGQDRDVLAATPKPAFAENFSESAADSLLKINVKYGALQTEPTLSDLVADGVMK